MTRHALTSALVASLLLSACQLSAPNTAAGAGKKSTTTSGSKTNVATAGKTPTASPTPEPILGTALTGMVKVDAAYVVAAGGGNVVAAGGGNVIAAGGGNVVAPGGGNVISPSGGNYRTFATADLPVGTILPAKGMSVQAVSMTTGKPFGKPVTTDEKGTFKLSVPKDQQDNVLIVATFPGSKDPRLTYPLVVSPTASADSQVDEDTTLVTKYLRQCMVGRLADVMAVKPTDDPVDALLNSGDNTKIPDFMRISAKAVFSKVLAASQAKGVGPDTDLATRTQYAQHMADAMLAKADLASLMTSDNKEKAVEALVDIMRQERTAAETQMKTDPKFFEQDIFVNTEVYHDGIKRPSDLGQFLCTEYLGRVGMKSFDKLEAIHQLIGVPAGQSDRVKTAASGIVQAMLLGLLTNTDTQDAVIKSFDQP